MAASGYIRAAASQLHQAAGDLQQQITRMQHDAENKRRELHVAIADLEKGKIDLKAKQQLSAEDVAQRRAIELEILRHDQEIKQKQGEASEVGSKAAGDVQTKIDAMNNLTSMATQLDSMAGAPEMN